MKKRLLSILTLVTASTLLAADRPVLFIAGKDSHKKGTHEHISGSNMLADMLNKSDLGIAAKVHKESWPESKAFEGVKAIVIFGDGDGNHPALKHAQELTDLADKNVGIVCIHYAVASEAPELNQALLDTIGGFFDVNWSVNPMWTMEKPILAKHPINNGVEPFTLKDEWYYHMRFREDMKDVTPILSAHPPAKSLHKKDGPRRGNPAVRKALADGKPQHLAWASETKSGRRGFGFTGGHYHFNWTNDQFRKLVLNAIVWAAGAKVPEKGVSSKTPSITKHKNLVQAVAKKDLEDIKRHIAKGADINEQNSSGWTPLHYAAVRGNTDAAALLIDKGAKINIKTKSSKTALHFAADRNFLPLAKLLVEKGADLKAEEKDGWTPLHYAAAKDHLDMAKFLVKSGAPINAVSTGGGTPLHEGAASAGSKMIKFLMKSGADKSLKARNGKTALDYAVELKNKEAEKILK